MSTPYTNNSSLPNRWIIAGIMVVSCALPLIARALAQRQSDADAVEVVAR